MKTLAIMPTIPGRNFAQSVIKNFMLQGSDICVYLNGFDSLPHWPSKINDVCVWYERSEEKRGPIVRYSQKHLTRPESFQFSGNEMMTYDIILLIDDDIDYPDDYVEVCCRELQKMGPKSAVGWHVSWWLDSEKFKFQNRSGIHCKSINKDYCQVPYAGSGALALWVDDFNNVISEDIPKLYEFEDDVWVSSRLAQNGVQIIRPPSANRWINPIENNKDTLWIRASKDDFKERTAAIFHAMKVCPKWKLGPPQWLNSISHPSSNPA